MSMIRWAGAATAAIAMAATAVPAQAQWHGGGGHRHWRGHGDRIDGGDVLLGALLAGGIIAVASAASKSNRDRADPRYDAPPPPPRDDARRCAL